MKKSALKLKYYIQKYGKLTLGVHFSFSAASITGLYVVIRSNVDVVSICEEVGLGAVISSKEKEEAVVVKSQPSETTTDPRMTGFPPKSRNRTAEIASSAGVTLALAVLCNKALFPVRVQITSALTPYICRFLVRRQLYDVMR